MAKVISPLHSHSASGSIGKVLTYSRQGGVNVVRRYTPQTRRKDARQVTIENNWRDYHRIARTIYNLNGIALSLFRYPSFLVGIGQFDPTEALLSPNRTTAYAKLVQAIATTPVRARIERIYASPDGASFLSRIQMDAPMLTEGSLYPHDALRIDAQFEIIGALSFLTEIVWRSPYNNLRLEQRDILMAVYTQ